jgi:hypothetical protein
MAGPVLTGPTALVKGGQQYPFSAREPNASFWYDAPMPAVTREFGPKNTGLVGPVKVPGIK